MADAKLVITAIDAPRQGIRLDRAQFCSSSTGRPPGHRWPVNTAHHERSFVDEMSSKMLGRRCLQPDQSWYRLQHSDERANVCHGHIA